MPPGGKEAPEKRMKKNLKKTKKRLAKRKALYYNNTCVTEMAKKIIKICAVSSAGRAPDS